MAIDHATQHQQHQPGPAAARLALDLCSDGVLIADPHPPFSIVFVNAVLCLRADVGAQELLGLSLSASADDPEQQLAAALADIVQGAGERSVTLHSPLIGGGRVWSDWRLGAERDAEGSLSAIVCVLDDATERARQTSRLMHLSQHDRVTGLPNRDYFNQSLQAQLARGAEAGMVGVLCLSLDGFNLVNESFGYLAGDALLVSVVQRLQQSLGDYDTLARHGGSQFGVLMPHALGNEQLGKACERLTAVMSQPFTIAGQPLQLGCSIGIACFPRDSSDSLTLLRYAEIALSQIAPEGGIRHQFFSAAMGERIVERASMEAALRVALAQQQLRLQYQPVAELQQGSICCMEALVRWQHPELGLIAASRFIALAEQCGLTPAIGEWTLQQATRDMAAWRAAGLAPVSVAINLSPKQFNDPGLEQAISRALADAGLDAQSLSLEVTEAALLNHADAGAARLARLKALGVGLTLDDFGTGYSALNHLKRFPIDEIKIDGALTSNLIGGTDEVALVNTIIAMAHHLGIRVTAEGVETEAQCDFLRRNMCDRIQGYFLAPPCTPAEMAALLGKGHALPAHLLRIQQKERTLLLVDDEINIVSSLKRLLRRDGYRILTANSGQEGLDVLAANDVDVIVSDQRMPGMIGADFLRAAKSLYPDTIRIMLSGYTELQSVTDAVNEGAIFKFLTKPWDDELLRRHIAEAFRLKEIADDNERLNLALRTANHELALANRRMEDVLRQKLQQISRDETSLSIARDLLQYMPLAVIGIDEEGMIAFINGAAATLLGQHAGALLGNEASVVLPELFRPEIEAQAEGARHRIDIGSRPHEVAFHPMGSGSLSRGRLITIHHLGEDA